MTNGQINLNAATTTSSTTPRRPRGRPPGIPNPNAGRRSAPPQNLPTAALVARCRLCPRAHYPGDRALYQAAVVSPRTWGKRVAGIGSFTADQLAAVYAVLNAHRE